MIDPVQIDPEALYDDGALYQALGLTPSTLAHARKSGALRHVRRGNRTLYKGAWIMAWLEADATQATGPHAPSKRPKGRGVAQ